jgi:arylformamidase
MPRLLSHPLGPSTPTFNGDPAPVFEGLVLTERGEPGNVHRISLVNHMSTHIDVPWHFNPHGLRLTDLTPDWFVYHRPLVVDLRAADHALVTAADLEPFTPLMEGVDLLMLRTGFGELRTTDPQRWGSSNPAFDPAAAEWFLRFPQLRALGMDTPSALTPTHMEEGIEFHRNMLGRSADDRFILIIEDMRLDGDLGAADLDRGVVVAPILLEDLDGGPTTVIAL